MKKYLLLTIAFFLGNVAVNAVPAYPGKLTVTLSNGKQVVLTHRGDEHFSFFTDEEGNAYRRAANKIGFEQISMEEVRNIWQPRMARANKARSARATKRVGTPLGDLTGKKKGLVILMQFDDYSFATENAKAVFHDFFNKTGYTDYGMTGSVKDYFKAQSYNKFELDFDVVGPYTAAHSMVYYGAHNGSSHDTRPWELIKEGCEQADAEVDFADYDWDGDGEVNQVFVIYAGYGENSDLTADNKFANCIWPHEYNLKYAGIDLKLDGKTISTYACGCELKGTEGADLDGIGTACHEFSHCLGLPDFYDTSGNNFGMSTWDVMDQGCYNNDSSTPSGYTSYERMFAGWLTPTELNTMTRVEGMKPLADSPEAYILYNENNRNEYYLLENRQLVGFDAGLYGHGLLVLHVDYDEETWHNNSVNVNSSHQRLTIIPADDKLVRTGTSLAGDPFPGTMGVTELTNYSTPAATLFNANTDGSNLMSKPIDNIKESDKGLISFVACRPELAIPVPGENKPIEGEASMTLSWSAVSGAIGYELEVTEIGTASNDPSEALEKEFNFEAFESKSAGLSDISTKMADYGYEKWKGSKLYTSTKKLRIGTSSTTGYVRTPTWAVPQSSDVTIVVGAQLYKAGTPVKGQVRVAFGNEGDQATYEEVPFELTEDGYMVFHFSIRKNLFWVEIKPNTCMYLNYLAIYDGEWTAEQLGLNASARQLSPRKASNVQTYQAKTNSYTLKNLNPKSRYIWRVRAMGEESRYSLWSEEKMFDFSGSNIVIKGDANGDGRANIADIVEIVNYIMGSPSNKFDEKAADVNGDDIVNADDIVELVKTMSGN